MTVPEMGSFDIAEITVGMSASYSHTITELDVEKFAEISGDRNPVHLNAEFAATTRFRRRIAHGLYSTSFFSRLFGTQLPGIGCVYVSQSVRFNLPVYIGDTVTATVVVKSVNVMERRVFFSTVCKVKKRIVIEGEAEIYIPPKRICNAVSNE